MALTRQASLMRGDARQKLREYLRDEDTVNPAYSDSQANRLLMDHYERRWQRYGNRIKGLAGADTFGDIALTTAGTALSWNYTGAAMVQKWLKLYLQTDANTSAANYASRELEKYELYDLMWLAKNRPQASSGLYPTAYALERRDGEGVAGPLWTVRLWPTAGVDATVWVSAQVYLQAPLAMSADSDVFDMDVEEANITVRSAAVDGCARMGWPDSYVDTIFRTLPADEQAFLRTRQNERTPRVTATEEPY